MCVNECVSLDQACCGSNTCKCKNEFSLTGCSGELFLKDEQNDYEEIKLIEPICNTCDSHVALVLSSVDRKGEHTTLNKFKNKKVKITIEEVCG